MVIWLSLFGTFINLHIVKITPTDIGNSLSVFLEYSAFGSAANRFTNQFLIQHLEKVRIFYSFESIENSNR